MFPVIYSATALVFIVGLGLWLTIDIRNRQQQMEWVRAHNDALRAEIKRLRRVA